MVRLAETRVGLGGNEVGLGGRGRTGRERGQTGGERGQTGREWGRTGGVERDRTGVLYVQKKIKHFSFKKISKILLNLVNFLHPFNPPGEMLILKWHLVTFSQV